MRAIGELGASRDPGLADVVAGFRATDEQRSLQYRTASIVLRLGPAGLAAEWTALAGPAWRTEIVSEIEQALDLWVHESTQEPYPVLSQIVEVLGYCAESDDGDARQALESLRSVSGEAFHVTHEAVDESKLDWRERLVAQRKGIPADRIRARITHRPTGLLDQAILRAALERIQARAPRP